MQSLALLAEHRVQEHLRQYRRHATAEFVRHDDFGLVATYRPAPDAPVFSRLLADQGLHAVGQDATGLDKPKTHGYRGFTAPAEPAPDPPVNLLDEGRIAVTCGTFTVATAGHPLHASHDPVIASENAAGRTVLLSQSDQAGVELATIHRNADED